MVDVLLRGQDNLRKDPTNQCDVTKEQMISVKNFHFAYRLFINPRWLQNFTSMILPENITSLPRDKLIIMKRRILTRVSMSVPSTISP